MKKAALSLAAQVMIIAFGATLAAAQSSGNFAAEVNTTTCTIDNTNGGLSSGIELDNFPWTTSIKVPNAGGTALIIRPSFVTGLLTTTKLQAGDTSATATDGVQVCVTLDAGKVNGIDQPAPVCAMYDKRFQQLKSNLFNTLLGTDCDPNTEGIQPCDLSLTLSTLGAHSFDFVAHDMPGGTRTVTVDVKFVDTNNTGGEAAACVGPGTVTVTQTKVFNSSGGIDITTP